MVVVPDAVEHPAAKVMAFPEQAINRPQHTHQVPCTKRLRVKDLREEITDSLFKRPTTGCLELLSDLSPVKGVVDEKKRKRLQTILTSSKARDDGDVQGNWQGKNRFRKGYDWRLSPKAQAAQTARASLWSRSGAKSAEPALSGIRVSEYQDTSNALLARISAMQLPIDTDNVSTLSKSQNNSTNALLDLPNAVADAPEKDNDRKSAITDSFVFSPYRTSHYSPYALPEELSPSSEMEQQMIALQNWLNDYEVAWTAADTLEELQRKKKECQEAEEAAELLMGRTNYNLDDLIWYGDILARVRPTEDRDITEQEQAGEFPELPEELSDDDILPGSANATNRPDLVQLESASIGDKKTSKKCRRKHTSFYGRKQTSIYGV